MKRIVKKTVFLQTLARNPKMRYNANVYEISRQFSFCYGHRLLDYNGKCAHPHGHNGKVKVYLRSEATKPNGMVADFNDLRHGIGQFLDKNLDHRMILQDGDPLIDPLRQQNEPMYVMPEPPTAENLAKLIYDEAVRLDFPVFKVEFWETEKCSATFVSSAQYGG